MDRQVIANEYIVELDDPRLGTLRVPGVPIALSDSPAQARPPPEPGYVWEEIQRLRENRTIL